MSQERWCHKCDTTTSSSQKFVKSSWNIVRHGPGSALPGNSQVTTRLRPGNNFCPWQWETPKVRRRLDSCWTLWSSRSYGPYVLCHYFELLFCWGPPKGQNFDKVWERGGVTRAQECGWSLVPCLEHWLELGVFRSFFVQKTMDCEPV